MTSKRYTICVDFDGVIHSYTSPWSETEIPDPPVPGVFEWLAEMCKHFKVVLFTTRAKTPEAKALVGRWFDKHGFAYAPLVRNDSLDITNVKPPALIYIDDRAYRFTGANFPTAQEIHAARPWNKLTPTGDDDAA